MITKEKLDIVRVGCGFDFGFCFSSVGNSRGLGYGGMVLLFFLSHI